MLKDLTVFIGYCDSHNTVSFLFFILLMVLPLKAIHTFTIRAFSIAKLELTALNMKGNSLYQRFRQLFSGAIVNFLHRCPGYLHPFPARLL